MNMGEAVIRVTADLTNFTQQQQQIVSESVSTGEKAARGFADKFGDYLERAKGQLSQKLQKAIDPDGIIRGLNAALEAFNAGEGVIASIEAAASSIPLFGAAYKLGKSIGTAISEAVTGEAAIARQLVAETEEMVRYVERRNQEQAQIEKERMAVAGGLSSARATVAGLRADVAADEARREGNLRQAAFEEFVKRQADIQRRLDRALADAKSDEEKALVREAADLERRLNDRNLEERFQQLQQQERDLARKRQESIDRANREAGDDAVKMFRENEKRQMGLAKEILDIERDGLRQRIATAQATGVAQTAAGAFVFNAYTDDEKKRNDEIIAAGIKDLVDIARTGGGGFN